MRKARPCFYCCTCKQISLAPLHLTIPPPPTTPPRCQPIGENGRSVFSQPIQTQRGIQSSGDNASPKLTHLHPVFTATGKGGEGGLRGAHARNQNCLCRGQTDPPASPATDWPHCRRHQGLNPRGLCTIREAPAVRGFTRARMRRRETHPTKGGNEGMQSRLAGRGNYSNKLCARCHGRTGELGHGGAGSRVGEMSAMSVSKMLLT